jgi:hypothetical protein
MKIAKLTALLAYEFDTMDHDTWARFEAFCLEHDMKNEIDGKRLPRNIRLLTKETEDIKAFEALARHYAENAIGLDVRTGRCACFIFVDEVRAENNQPRKLFQFFTHEHDAGEAWKQTAAFLADKYGNDIPENGANK